MEIENINFFETERMVAQRISESDFDNIFLLNNDLRVAETLGGTKSEIQVRSMLTNYINQWATYGYGYWIFFNKDTSEFIGRGGLRHVPIDDVDEIEIGYALMPKFWGQGFATEIGRAAIQAAASLANINSLVCFTLPTNKASLGVIKKLGFLYEKNFVYQNIEAVLYRLMMNKNASS